MNPRSCLYVTLQCNRNRIGLVDDRTPDCLFVPSVHLCSPYVTNSPQFETFFFPRTMHYFLASLLLVVLSCQSAFGTDSNSTISRSIPTGDAVIVEKIPLPNITIVTPIHESPSITRTAIPTTVRAKRQIGYGALGSGLAAGLSGISSGYGYGYNNAVGLQGQGVGQGSGVQVAPLGFGMGGGFGGGLGYGGYGALPVGYGNIGQLGVAGLNGGYGPVGYGGGGVVPVGGLGSGLAGQGAGGAGWSAPAVAAAAPQITSAVVPTTGGGAYGRSDDSVPAASSSSLSNTQPQTSNNQPQVPQTTNVQG